VQLTRSSINWFGLPIRIRVVLHFGILKRLDRLVLVYEGIPSLVVSDKIGNNTTDGIWTLSGS
jgi:hypothetical protein